ncbi:hypothetical protein HDE_02546 [Halotydeus destructor]|nr:hypothetical protein HDE_02546 [Halotydeus destructor]
MKSSFIFTSFYIIYCYLNVISGDNDIKLIQPTIECVDRVKCDLVEFNYREDDKYYSYKLKRNKHLLSQEYVEKMIKEFKHLSPEAKNNWYHSNSYDYDQIVISFWKGRVNGYIFTGHGPVYKIEPNNLQNGHNKVRLREKQSLANYLNRIPPIRFRRKREDTTDEPSSGPESATSNSAETTPEIETTEAISRLPVISVKSKPSYTLLVLFGFLVLLTLAGLIFFATRKRKSASSSRGTPERAMTNSANRKQTLLKPYVPSSGLAHIFSLEEDESEN